MARACTLLLYDVLLVRVAIEDLEKKKISNRYPVMILVLALLAAFTIPEITLISRLQGMFAVSIPMTILALIFPGSFGGGDVKLTFACGAFLGWRLLLDGVIAAIFFAGSYCIWLIIIRKEKRNMQFAFGPFLSIGFILVTGNL